MSHPTRPTIDLVRFEGLYTKSNQDLLEATQLRECKNADFFNQVGSTAKARGNKRILSDIYRESSVAMPIPWCGFYKATNEAGVELRHTLIGAGTTVQRVESDGSLTELATDFPNNLVRDHDMFDRFMLITSQDPDAVGQRGDFLKYDGVRMLTWGLDAPGEDEVVVEPFTDASGFTYSNASGTIDSTIAYKGQSSLKLVTAATGATGYAEKTGEPAFAINNVVEDRARVQVYVPRDQFRKLAGTGAAISVYVGSDPNFSNNYYRYDFRVGQLFFGWNTLYLDFSVFPSGTVGATVGTPNDGALVSYRFEVNTNNASDEATLYFDQFVSLDQGTPDGTFTSPGGDSFPSSSGSIWSYRTTYVDENGIESNGGPESVEFTNDTGTDYGDISLTNIPTSPDDKVVARKLYRTIANGNDWLFLATINDNTTTTYTDSIPDGSLGVSSVPLSGDTLDHSPPPFAGIVKVWKRTVFMAGDPENPTVLYFSLDDNPDAFPLNNGFEFDSKITGIYETRMGLVVTTETDHWRVIGDNPDYIVDKIMRKKGAVGYRGVGESRMYGWAHDVDGLRLYDLADTIKITERIRDRVDGFNKANLKRMWSIYSQRHNLILAAYQDSSGTYTDYYAWQHLLDDVREGWWYELDIPGASGDFDGLEFLCAAEVQDEDGVYHLYVGGNDGMLYELYPSDELNWTDARGQQKPVTITLETPFLRLGAQPGAGELQGTTGRARPVMIEVRATEKSGLDFNVAVKTELAPGAGDNQTIAQAAFDETFEFPAGETLQRIPMSPGNAEDYTRFTITCADLDREVIITGIRAYVEVKEGQSKRTGTKPAGQS